MTTYRALEGTDVVLGSLTVLDPAPDPGGAIQYTRISTSADGTITQQGAFFDFKWTEMDNSDYNTILGVFGLDDSASTNVTIYIRNVTYQSWVRMNGVAQQPVHGDGVNWTLRPRNITIRVTHLETAA